MVNVQTNNLLAILKFNEGRSGQGYLTPPTLWCSGLGTWDSLDSLTINIIHN